VSGNAAHTFWHHEKPAKIKLSSAQMTVGVCHVWGHAKASDHEAPTAQPTRTRQNPKTSSQQTCQLVQDYFADLSALLGQLLRSSRLTLPLRLQCLATGVHVSRREHFYLPNRLSTCMLLFQQRPVKAHSNLQPATQAAAVVQQRPMNVTSRQVVHARSEEIAQYAAPTYCSRKPGVFGRRLQQEALGYNTGSRRFEATTCSRSTLETWGDEAEV